MRGIAKLPLVGVALAVVWLAPTAARAAAAAAAASPPVAGLDRPQSATGTHSRSVSGFDASQNLVDSGGPVLHSSTVRLIFWDPTTCGGSPCGLSWEAGYRELMTQFMQDVAADAGKQINPYSLTPQYGNASGPAPYNTAVGTCGGARCDDTDPAPANAVGCTPPSGWSWCLSQSQESTEVKNFITAHGLPTGMQQIYMLVTPYGVGSCNNAGTSCLFTDYCAYHSFTQQGGAGSPGDGNTVLWANVPYTHGYCRKTWPLPNGNNADTELSSISHEDLEIITDPLAGYATAWQDSSGNEIGDKCAGVQGHYQDGSSGSTAYDTTIHGHHYNIQAEWSNADNGSCQMSEGPVASFAVSTPAASRTAGSPVAFDGSAAADLDNPDGTGKVAAYAWNFGDGSATVTGAAPSHAFASPGTYAVRLTVTDSEGNTDSTVNPVTIDDLTASFSVSPGGVARPGQSLTFDGTSSTDPDGSVPLHQWDFGDGTTTTGRTPTHAYAADGVYTVTMTAYDNSGQHQATTTEQIIVDEGPSASASVTTTHPMVGVPVSFSSAGSSDPDGSLVAYAWNFGDGGTDSSASPSHVYSQPGNYTVTLTVTDSSGQSASAPVSIIVPATITGASVIKKHGRRFLIISVNGAGGLIVGGKTFHALGPGQLKIKLQLTARQAKQLAHHHAPKLKVVFLPVTGSPQTVTVKLR